MIRVNLLPIQEARERTAGRWQLVVFAVLLVAELGGFVGLYWYKNDQVQAMEAKVAEAEKRVQKLKKRVEETRKFEQKYDELKQKQQTLETIQSEAIGPGPMLRELQVLLSKARNMEQRYAQREKGWNVEWNPTQLWIKTLEERDKGFTLKGLAIDADDVAEFLHRLETASHFHDVKLDYVRPKDDSGDEAVVEFRVTGKITYRAKDDIEDDSGSGSGASSNN